MSHLFAALIVVLTLTACGGGGGDADSPPPAGGGGDPVTATAPSILTQPAVQGVTAPAPATFSVTSAGSAPLTYQWRSSSDGTDWTPIAGATGASYDTGATDPAMDGRYYAVVVSNSAGSVTSASARLTVRPASGGGTGPSGEFPHPSNPLAAAVTRADAALASFFIGSSADATLQSPAEVAGVALAGGVTVSVGLPGNTFLEDQSLSVTPVTLAALDAAHPLPFQSVIGAFDLAPSDTNIPELQATNLLRITFTLTQAALDALDGHPVIFSARSDGTQLHLVPVFRNPDGTWSALTLTARVGHLGVFGIASMSDPQAAALAAAWPSFDDFQFETAIAPASYELRKVMLATQPAAQTARTRSPGRVTVAASGETDWAAQIQARTDAYYNDQVVPALNAAGAENADIAQFRDASLKILTWERMRQLLDLQDGRDAEVTQRLLDLLKRGLDKALAECSAHPTAAATAQTLGMLRQLALMGYESDVTEQSLFERCGQATYDVSVNWKQVHSLDIPVKFDGDPLHAYTGRRQQSIDTGGNLRLAAPNPQLTGVTFDLSASTQTVCAAGAALCTSQSTATTAHDTAPSIVQCGSGFSGSYSVDHWNLDARGHYTGPTLNVRFQNLPGCTGSSFIVSTNRATQTNYDANGSVSSTTTIGTAESVDTTTWNGTAGLGSGSRVVRRSVAVTGENVEPGATERWTTSLTFNVTEVQPGN